MSDYILPALFTLFVWWFSTGVILYLDGLPRRTFRFSFLAATALLIASLYGLHQVSIETTVPAAYLAFLCAILIWGWNETAFLMGYITGSRTAPCPPRCGGWRHFFHAAQTIIYHELAILISLAAVVAATWNAPNQFGVWTFVILWLMRLSTKLNVFLGVPNLAESFLPEHLSYLKSFFNKKPMNLLFPFSVTASTLLFAWLLLKALAPETGGFELAGLMMLVTLTLLGMVEHWFLVMPPQVLKLWSWGLRSHERKSRLAAVKGRLAESL